MLLEELRKKRQAKGTHVIAEERNGLVEAVHRAHVAVVNQKGELLFSSGNPNYLTFSRSCMKPFQALPLLTSGAFDHFDLNERELAVISGSHSGETAHVELVRSILKKGGIDESYLRCGGHLPFHQETAIPLMGKFAPIHDNCSGKHAGVLLLSRFRGYPLDSYLNMDHPAQREVTAAVSDLSGVEPERIIIGVDGCGLPNHALTIDRYALMFARLGYPTGQRAHNHLERIRNAMMADPYLVAGTGRFDTTVMEDFPGKVISKGGAVGLQSMAIESGGRWLGISLKVEDGSYQAVTALAYHVLDELGMGPGLEKGDKFRNVPVDTRSGRTVGGFHVLGGLRGM